MIRVIRNTFREEIVFVIATLLAIFTGFFAPTRLEAIDLSVVIALFNLMLITLAFEKYHLLDFIATNILLRARTERSISLLMIGLTAFLALLITNDVALITVVPITIGMSRKAGFNPYRVITLETIAANIGSSLTPFGNPQNLFLFSFYKIPLLSFMAITAPFVIIGLFSLCILALWHKKVPMNISIPSSSLVHKKKIFFYLMLFILVILSILRILPMVYITILVVVTFLLFEKSLIKKVEYYLLGTFISFFIFIDHMIHIPFFIEKIPMILGSDYRIFTFAAIVSQGISNVPTALLFSGFTPSYKPLLLGVSVGGMGTMVASLANLIAYKFYQKKYDTAAFKKYFYIVNFGLLGLFLVLFMIAFL